MNSPHKPTFQVKTVGCKLNQYETEAMRASLLWSGFKEEDEGAPPEWLIVNSCTVTSRADRDTRNLIHNFHKKNPTGKVAVAGCYAETEKDRKTLSSIPGVTCLIRNSEKERVAEMLANIPADKRAGNRSQIKDFKGRNRAFVKVQDGCDYRCSYCKVRLVRGPSKSRDEKEILAEIKDLIKQGFREIVLTGVCLGAWGADLKSGKDLTYLLKRISGINENFRIRLSSIEPAHVTDEIIKVLKTCDNVCRHLHIPLQSGDDKTLKAMNRTYTSGKFLQLIKKARKEIPDIAITTDVMVGFPGEGEKSFENTMKTVKAIKPSRMHIFSYSRRDGTKAASYGKVPESKTARKRANELIALGNILAAEFAKKFIGKEEKIIVENERDRETGLLTGYTERYVKALVDGPDTLKNSFCEVYITGVDSSRNILLGRI